MRSKHDENKKLRSQKVKLCFFGLVLCFLNIVFCFSNPSFVSAVSYNSSTNVQFTFNPTLSMSVSGDLVIDSLAPGSSSDSNVITVSVNTNSAYGYQLSATVGTKTGGEDALVNGNNEFTNLTSNVSSLSNFSDNSWGYSYSTDSGTNWISGNVGSSSTGYNGLPLDNNDDTNLLGYGGVTLIDTNTLSNNNSIQFKIGAKASTTQPAGTYTNTVNFYAITYKAPVNLYESYRSAGKTMLNGYFKLQDMTSSICSAVEVEDDELQVIDIRDNKVYWIAKLKDGNCWMTQNLDLDLDNTITYTHANTDLGWGTDTVTTSWTPVNSTINVNANGTFTGWTDDYNYPYSANPGDWYYAGYDGTTLLTSTTVNYLTSTNKVTDGNGVTTVYNDANYTTAYFRSAPFTGSGTSNNGTHGHVGNYYNWSAAVASNDTSSYTASTYSDITGNPQSSICPAGWRLPVITSYSASAIGTNEFANLNYYYNNKVTNTSAGLEASPLFFARGGYVLSGSLRYSGDSGRYWSSTVYSGSNAYRLHFYATNVNPAGYNALNLYRYGGFSVRCVAR